MNGSLLGPCLRGLALLFGLLGVSHGQSYVLLESEAENAARGRIEHAVATVGSVSYTNTPLREVAGDLSRRIGVPIVLATKALEEAAINADTPVSKNVEGVSYRSLMRLVLRDLGLTWTFRDEVIVITTPEDAESMLETRLYPVRDLVTVANEEYGDYDTLIDAITTTIEPDSWDEVGGPGTISEFPNAAALMISQTPEIHEQVDKLLAAVRRTKEIQGIPSVAIPRGKPKRVASRRLETPQRVFSSSAAESWQVPRLHAE